MVAHFSPGSDARHGSILQITGAEQSRVLGRWASTAVSRVQSYNFQDRYLRHANYDVRIGPNVSPAQDGQWRIVPGLAGSGTVSFQSVNHPDHYLRHWGYVLRIDTITNATGRADAAFRSVG